MTDTYPNQDGTTSETDAPSLKNGESNSKERGDDVLSSEDDYPSMTFALFIYWILPLLLLSVFGRLGVDTEEFSRIPLDPINSGGPRVQISAERLQKSHLDYERKKNEFEMKVFAEERLLQKKRRAAKKKAEEETESESIKEQKVTVGSPIASVDAPSALPPPPSSSPTMYQSVVSGIKDRRPRWQHGPSTATKQNQRLPSASPVTTSRNADRRASASSQDDNPERRALRERIQELKKAHESDRTDVFKALDYADAMRMWGLTFFDGGSHDQQAIAVYARILIQLRQDRKAAVAQGKETDVSASGTRDVPGELRLPYKQKSIDGLLCAVYTGLGKLYFMANMFGKSDMVLTYCLEIEPNYLDAAKHRGSTRIVLGMFDEAAQDFLTVIAQDSQHIFSDAYSGLARVLEAKEDATPMGWNSLVPQLESEIEKFESIETEVRSDPHLIRTTAEILRRYHHALFVYHDKKTKDCTAAFHHLQRSHENKLANLPHFQAGSERNRLVQIQSVFGKGFWPEGMGGITKAPVFVIGFPRCGSTLLERVLDAHPFIAGMGENSVFNGQLDSIRLRFIEASQGGGQDVPLLAREIADEVVDDMRDRWKILEKNKDEKDRAEEWPLRFVDKMLTNYFNIGFIHMLFPNALILHMVREPMDTIFSAFKHDFPADRLAHTADPNVLVELYTTYRDTMSHWEEVLPGRITHVRYEDMVNDMPGMARAVIDAVGLEWNDSVLDFHKKQHYVNTYSTTQVRKQVYKDAIKSWKRCETQLEPLVKQLGDYVNYEQQTTLPSYKKRPHDEL